MVLKWKLMVYTAPVRRHLSQSHASSLLKPYVILRQRKPIHGKIMPLSWQQSLLLNF